MRILVPEPARQLRNAPPKPNIAGVKPANPRPSVAICTNVANEIPASIVVNASVVVNRFKYSPAISG